MRCLFLLGASILLAATSLLAQSGPVEDPIAFLLEARDDYRAGRFEQSLAKMERATTLLPGSPGPVFYMALTNARLDRREESLRWRGRLADFGVHYPVDTVSALSPVGALPGYPPLRARFQRILEHEGGAEVALQNGYRPERVVQAELDAAGDRVVRLHVLDAADPRFAVPTTRVVVGDTLFLVATSQLDAFDRKGGVLREKLRENGILKVKLR